MSDSGEAPAEPALRMTGVDVGSMRDPATTVLSGVDWTVQPGDFWVLAGLQGAGKSDFLMMTAGLIGPLNGHYWLFGQEMPLFAEHQLPDRLRLGLAFENGQLFNHLTVSENLALPIRYHRNLSRSQAASEVQAMLEVMELGPWADSTPGALSRNWHKRVGFARALMLKPDVLLVDNPLAGLDLRHMDWWLNILEQLSCPNSFLRPEPITLVVTTADLRPWLRLGREFAVLRRQHLTVLGDRSSLAAAREELVGELLAPKRPND